MLKAAHDTPAMSPERLSPPQDRDRIDAQLDDFLDANGRRFAANPHVRPLFQKLSDFVLRGGKRLRPRLTLAAYRILSGGKDIPDAAWDVAASLEIFHAFMLVHDDLIDESVLRRDWPTLHEQVRRESVLPQSRTARKRGYDLGIIAGDLLCSLGMQMVSRAGLEGQTLGRVHQLISEMLLETGLGEALDVLYDDCPLAMLTEEQIVEAYLRKTARYSVSGPLVLGAILAGASDEVIEALDRFGDLLGFGYQVRNDLEALDADPETGDHSDLDGGKRTFVLWTAFNLLPEPRRRRLDAALRAPVSTARRALLLDLIRESGAIDVCRARLLSLQQEAVAVLRDSGLSQLERRQFVALTELFQIRLSVVPEHAPSAPLNMMPIEAAAVTIA